MADDSIEFDDSFPEARVGAKIIEMCDRVKTAHSCVPGAVGHWGLTIDNVRFEVKITVAGSAD